MVFEKTGESDGFIILSDGKNSAKFEFVEMTVYNGEEYAVLLQQGDDMVLILRFEECENGRERYYTVDDDAVFDSIYNAFKKEFGDEFSFE